ncbi:hypothetical protein TNCV_2392841 [Trichonephila clavipes]|nr:hypothetical protein TNCV_2392841 [Trichonephila clavipes]
MKAHSIKVVCVRHCDEADHFPPITTDTSPLPTNVAEIPAFFINSWEGISELGPRRHKETHQQCVLFSPDPVTTARLETHNVYPDIGAHGARAGMRRNRWDRLRDTSSKEPSPIGAEKGQNIRG